MEVANNLTYGQDGIVLSKHKDDINSIKIYREHGYTPIIILEDLLDTEEFTKSLYSDNKSFKKQSRVEITRNSLPKMKIEEYTNRIVVSGINETDRRLDFYVSAYPEQFNRNSKIFINEVKKLLSNGKSNIIDLESLHFITNDDIGVPNYLEFLLDNMEYIETVAYNQYYIISFNSKVNIDGVNLLKQYIDEDLEKRYENNAPRK